MKKTSINQEILLFTGSSYISRPFYQRDTDDNKGRNYSAMEELERACWEGMLKELLPELAGSAAYDNDNHIWSTVSGVNFLCISIGSCPVIIEKETSLDPYCFLSFLSHN